MMRRKAGVRFVTPAGSGIFRSGFVAEPQRPNRPEPGGGWRAPFAWIEFAMQWVVLVLAGSATFRVVCGLGILAVSVVPVIYVIEGPERQQAREHLRWLVLVDAGSRPGGGVAVKGILEDFHQRGSISLAGLQLRHKNLSGLRVPGAKLARVDFTGTKLVGADLHGADLTAVNFDGADLNSANLAEASLPGGRARGTCLLYTSDAADE